MLNTLRLIYHQYIYKGLLQMVSGFIFCLNPVNFQKKLNLYSNPILFVAKIPLLLREQGTGNRE